MAWSTEHAHGQADRENAENQQSGGAEHENLLEVRIGSGRGRANGGGGARRGGAGVGQAVLIQNFGFKSSPDTLPADFGEFGNRSPASYTTCPDL